MLNVCTDDDQLGMVLSHEIAHTLLNHAVSCSSIFSIHLMGLKFNLLFIGRNVELHQFNGCPAYPAHGHALGCHTL